jgi:very-short-patch-repair endonuclease
MDTARAAFVGRFRDILRGMPRDPVTERLLQSRIELLDLSLRNPLLNWRPSKRRGVEVVDEKAAQVFGALVVERQPLRFHPTRASEEKPAGEEMFWVDEEAEGQRTPGTLGVGAANPAGSLATPYTKEQLAHRLLETHYDAWLSLQEQGANTLFLAIGMLRWKEGGPAEQDRLAPVVLVPVRLERKSARASWQLLALDEDPGPNLSLVEKLKEFAVPLPASPPLESSEELESYLGLVEKALPERPGWAVERDRIVLGFFSFGKFLMYRDLDPDHWPPERRPDRHAVLSALLLDGFRDRGPAVAPDADMDEVRPPGPTMEVLDCDSSQAEALAEVAAGRNLVVQGPPGTGKSQTISNLIAEAVWAGKRVLFVAEKLAALEVVKRRLDNVGLGPLCLELHSHKASKKEVAADLARTLDLGKPEAPAGGDDVHSLPELRGRLNGYARAASRPVGATETSPYQAIGALERLDDRPEPLARISPAPLAEWTRAQFDAARSRVQDLGAKVAELGIPARHPFEGCGLTELAPAEAERIGSLLAAAAASAREIAHAAAALGASLGADPARDLGSMEGWTALGDVALQAPDLRGVPPVGPAWDRPEPLGAAAEALRGLEEVRRDYGARLTPQAWNADVDEARRDLVVEGASWWRRLISGRYRAARRAVQALSNPPVPVKPRDLVAAADAILRSRRLKSELAEAADACGALAGEKWRGLESSHEELRSLREWGSRFRAVAVRRKLAAAVAAWVVGEWDREAVRSALERARAAQARWRAAWEEVSRAMAFAPLETLPFEEGLARAEGWRAELPRLPGYVGYWKLNREVARLGLPDLSELAHRGTADLAPVLERAWAAAILDRAFRERPELRGFDATTHERAAERFRRADQGTFGVNRARLAERHWRALPGGAGYGQVGRVRHESAKKARHLPLRQLMERAGAAVQALKPVFLMSPLSVASYLPPGGPSFDLVVFDEASQVKPVDAFGAILRGRQVVVVGDEKQLPPTSFFETMVSGEGPPEEEASVTEDLQSVLDLCRAKGMPSRMLRWHYRSRHDTLIALSNREFYGGDLVVFPSPHRNREGEGLLYRHLGSTVYERGGSRANPLEADAVAEAVLAHARARPELSLGVVAFSRPQREAIEARVEALSRRNPQLDRFVNGAREEPFFVKNLENVQGDERDVMMISVGYGRDAAGAVSMNFGPLNQAGGERRLNVLITRARRQCAVFTNLQPDDLDLRRAPGAGVRAFKAFLAFARDGSQELPAAGRGPGGDFEAQVAAALARKGYEVHAQVGSGGYLLDLAVADPASPGRYLLGIEFDGPRYQGARWARDRDRLREAVLRDLGWRLHRVWAADWHRSRQEALRRLVEAIERARTVPGPSHAGAPPEPLKRDSRVPPPGPAGVAAYEPARVEARLGETHLAEVDKRDLAEFVAAIVDAEGPVHLEEVRRRVLQAAQRRPGTRLNEAIDEAVGLGASSGRLRRRGDFLWPKADRPVFPRDRSSLPDESREIDLVCDEECRAALVRVVEEACGCGAEEAAVQAVRLLGVKRNDAAISRLGGLAGGLVAEGALRRTAGGLVPGR